MNYHEAKKAVETACEDLLESVYITDSIEYDSQGRVVKSVILSIHVNVEYYIIEDEVSILRTEYTECGSKTPVSTGTYDDLTTTILEKQVVEFEKKKELLHIYSKAIEEFKNIFNEGMGLDFKIYP